MTGFWRNSSGSWIQPPTIPKNIRQHKLVKQKIDQIDNEKYNENITANLKDIDDFQNSELKIQKLQKQYFWHKKKQYQQNQ